MRRCASDAQKLEQLRRLIREIEYLKYTLNSTLYWDKMTYMPEKGLTYRSEVMSFLGAQLYERFRSPELRSLVDHFSRQKDAPPQVSAMVRRVESNYIYINKIPQAEYQTLPSLQRLSRYGNRHGKPMTFSGLLPIWSGLWIPSGLSPDIGGTKRSLTTPS